MKQFKFRGKNPNTNEWVYGSLLQTSDCTLNCIINQNTVAPGKPFEVDKVDPDTIGMFTEICDSDGKEIYRGDIITVVNEPTNYSATILVEINPYYGIVFGIFDNNIVYDALSVLKVIGNAYDNPELLDKLTYR
jgi:uncharacterized phage protein (TIGR01671 family)